MDIKIPDNVKEVIGKRGIKEADIEAVVKEAESSNKKLVKNGRNLAKKKIGDVLVYVDYDIDKGVLSKLRRSTAHTPTGLSFSTS
jgi:hypothetical protein